MYFSREAEASRAENPEDKTHQELDKLKRDLTPRQERKKARHERWVARKEARKDFLEKKLERREEKGRNTQPIERRIGRIERRVARYDENGNWLNRRERQARLENTLNKNKRVSEVADPWERETSFDDYLYFGPDQPSETNTSYVDNNSSNQKSHETYDPQEELTPHQENLREIKKWLEDPYLGEIEYIAKLVLPNFQKGTLSDEEGAEEVLQQIRGKIDNNEIGPRLAGEIKIYLEAGPERRAEHIARLENIHSKLDSLSINQLRGLAKIFDPTFPDKDLQIEAFVKGVPTKDGTLIGVLPWLKEDLKNVPGDFTFDQSKKAESFLSKGKTETNKKSVNPKLKTTQTEVPSNKEKSQGGDTNNSSETVNKVQDEKGIPMSEDQLAQQNGSGFTQGEIDIMKATGIQEPKGGFKEADITEGEELPNDGV